MAIVLPSLSFTSIFRSSARNVNVSVKPLASRFQEPIGLLVVFSFFSSAWPTAASNSPVSSANATVRNMKRSSLGDEVVRSGDVCSVATRAAGVERKDDEDGSDRNGPTRQQGLPSLARRVDGRTVAVYPPEPNSRPMNEPREGVCG